MKKIYRMFFLLLFSTITYADSSIKPAITTPFSVSDIQHFANYRPTVKTLITEAADLTKQHLTYIYGSADPANKGMDCSGTIYYLLTQNGIKNAPRSANSMYEWVRDNKTLYPVTSQNFDSADFSHLKPGDLLFWSGTYKTTQNITHVMLYLGLNENNKPVMFGSSDGRVYQNKKMWGVSIFDFTLPGKKDQAKFVGYSCIPQLTC